MKRDSKRKTPLHLAAEHVPEFFMEVLEMEWLAFWAMDNQEKIPIQYLKEPHEGVDILEPTCETIINCVAEDGRPTTHGEISVGEGVRMFFNNGLITRQQTQSVIDRLQEKGGLTRLKYLQTSEGGYAYQSNVAEAIEISQQILGRYRAKKHGEVHRSATCVVHLAKDKGDRATVERVALKFVKAAEVVSCELSSRSELNRQCSGIVRVLRLHKRTPADEGEELDATGEVEVFDDS